MRFHKGDIVEVNFLFADGRLKVHPALVVSNDELQEVEGIIYLALISSKATFHQYAFSIEDGMANFNFAKPSYVKCQIIVANVERDIYRKLGIMKLEFVEKVIEKIKQSIF
ncbi:prepilin-type processing-associated H-X9-DG domain-containing protein [Cruoricaptor ignavus]|uniref:Prepilin-type processing-associated H-X9-DG domain-containing protein n=1 Tax=Cruoricaptor ignavus TaxID=1118202 RepID=A0A1M6D5Z5_9FLAO|nr:type II toxin-antitoxin system PemK/MazF family toxin [Cruoricaptor ignavus]SHI68675.1 prepilin-type processing-associated H-X9-DG domain-containing protein [Cruoricaptor ignavus]